MIGNEISLYVFVYSLTYTTQTDFRSLETSTVIDPAVGLGLPKMAGWDPMLLLIPQICQWDTYCTYCSFYSKWKTLKEVTSSLTCSKTMMKTVLENFEIYNH